MSVERQVEIERPIEEVFAFVADARNDSRWCPTVISCEQVDGEGPAAGARYLAQHKPTPFHKVMPRTIEVLELDSPTRVASRQEDDNGVFSIAYSLAPTERGTRFTQSDEIDWKVSKLSGRFAELVFVRRHIAAQMQDLKRLLEQRAGD